MRTRAHWTAQPGKRHEWIPLTRLLWRRRLNFVERTTRKCGFSWKLKLWPPSSPCNKAFADRLAVSGRNVVRPLELPPPSQETLDTGRRCRDHTCRFVLASLPLTVHRHRRKAAVPAVRPPCQNPWPTTPAPAAPSVTLIRPCPQPAAGLLQARTPNACYCCACLLGMK